MSDRESLPSAHSPLSPSNRLWGLLLLALVTACSRNEAPRPARPPAPAARQPEPAGAPFDVSAVIRQVHFAYRPEAEGWSAGHSTYTVRASTEGLTLTPFQQTSVREPRAPREARKLREARTSPALEGAPLTLGPARLTRGDSAPGSTRKALGRVEEDGHLALARGDFTEHLRNDEDGVEQSWSFDKAPSGQGDLLVRVPVKGLAYTGVTDGGLHFADARTGLGFRYGHATWVDAEGRKTALRAGYAQGHIQLRVPAALLDASAYPAVLDPRIGPEFGMDNPVLQPLAAYQDYSAVAWNGTSWLVVWEDERSSSTNGSDVYGTRVSSAGEVLDPAGLPINTQPLYQGGVAIASDGTDWFVIWSSDSGTGTGGTGSDVLGTRVSATGQVQNPAGLPISNGI